MAVTQAAIATKTYTSKIVRWASCPQLHAPLKKNYLVHTYQIRYFAQFIFQTPDSVILETEVRKSPDVTNKILVLMAH